jgi:hypothetical protein
MALEACAGGLLTQQLQDSVLADDGAGETNSDTVQYPILAPDGNKIAGGFGSPRQCQQPGKERQDLPHREIVFLCLAVGIV